ncbi:MAG TPA: ribonucleoside-diphosphate reductase subunit alpha, partial [Methylothermaceae bacterium]|nr:ribonucleoside-diphosphate reductase subunit alpha [Methylothermaceae bacterium]
MEANAMTKTGGTSAYVPQALSAEVQAMIPEELKVIRRNGKLTGFDPNKIRIAITKAFLAVEGGQAAASRRIHDTCAELTEQVVRALMRRLPTGGTVHIEDIQDQVELALMRGGHHKVARAYVLYREERARLRAEKAKAENRPQEPELHVTDEHGQRKPLDVARMRRLVEEACQGLDDPDPEWILQEAQRNLYDGVPENEVIDTLIMAARLRIEQSPDYGYVAARLLLDKIRSEALGFLSGHFETATGAEMEEGYGDYFQRYIRRAIDLELLDPTLGQYDLEQLAKALKPERDFQFTYLGLQTLYDRYFIHHDGTRFELPQAFFMRVAMGLAKNEIDREARAIE